MIQDHQEQFDITLMCDLLEVSRQGYYDWVDRPPSASAIRRDAVVAAIRLSHVESHCRYGSPNIHQDLLEKGIACCVNTVARRMREHGIRSIVNKRFRVTTTDSRHDQPVFENRLDRDFTADGPDRKWAADITYIPTDEGFTWPA
jgi:putative transposase